MLMTEGRKSWRIIVKLWWHPALRAKRRKIKSNYAARDALMLNRFPWESLASRSLVFVLYKNVEKFAWNLWASEAVDEFSLLLFRVFLRLLRLFFITKLFRAQINIQPGLRIASGCFFAFLSCHGSGSRRRRIESRHNLAALVCLSKLFKNPQQTINPATNSSFDTKPLGRGRLNCAARNFSPLSSWP